MNQLREQRNELAQLDYSDWLSKIIAELNGESGSKIFVLKKDPSDGRMRLIVDLHSFATHIAKIKEIRLPLAQGERSYRATINMSNKCHDIFGQNIQKIKMALSKRLSQAIRETLGASYGIENDEDTINQLTDSILLPLASNPKAPSLFNWEFAQIPGLSSQELTLEPELDTPTIRSHKVTIEIRSATQFRESVLTALESHINLLKKDYNPEDAEYIIKNVRTNINAVKTNGSDELSRLEKLINQETIGRLKRESEIVFLESCSNLIGKNCDEEWESIQKSKTIHSYPIKGEKERGTISLREASFYLRDYSRRIRLLEKFINDRKRPDGDYELTYQGCTVKIKELFSRGDAFRDLPIVGQINGCMGETDDPQKSLTAITFGLRFKLNGRVQNPVSYDSSFAYHLDVINPDSDLHQTGLNEKTQEERNRHIEKIIKVFILYYFAFACPNPLPDNYNYEDVINFDVVGQFTQKVLPILKIANLESDEDKKKLMREFIQNMDKYSVSHKLESIVKIIKEYLDKEQFLLSATKEINIGLSDQLLLSDLRDISNKDHFFGKDLYSDNLKDCLKYVFISSQGITKGAIVQFPVKLKLETDNFYRTRKKCQFSMIYQTDGIHLLPVFYRFLDRDADKQLDRDKANIQNLRKLLKKQDKYQLPENSEQSGDMLSRLVFSGSVIEFNVQNVTLENATDKGRFIYEITFKTLGLIVMEILTAKARETKKIFVGEWILHETKEEKTTQQETLVHQMIEEWNHVLRQFMLVNSQGIVMNDINPYKTPNAKQSLYSVLPQEYREKDNKNRSLERLLIVMVSSNKCDARASRWGENYIANLTGEIVAVEKTKTGIKVSRVKTLTGNYSSDELHRSPYVLRDSISQMYQEGFRHILYIAKTPFSNELRITDQQNELFFMSPEIIRFLKKIGDDIIIYPILYDSYSALRINNQINEETLYVHDVRQLGNVFNDPNRSHVVFFNLFTGKTLDKSKTVYNTVTTYSTLLKAHPGDVVDVNKIVDGLIKDEPLKHDIMFYLMLLHYSRYEKKQTRNDKSFLKLDPLNEIIGDGSIGRASAKSQHCIPGVQMNYLAFLTEVYERLSGASTKDNDINVSTNSLQKLLSMLDEIEDYLVTHEVIDPHQDLPQQYHICLVESFQEPMLSTRVKSIFENQKYPWELLSIKIKHTWRYMRKFMMMTNKLFSNVRMM